MIANYCFLNGGYTGESGMKSLKEQVQIMQAYLDRKKIQHKLSGEWKDCVGEPLFKWYDFDYRIKPASPVVLYQALCKHHDGTYFIATDLYANAETAKEERATFVRLLTEHPITVEVPE